MSERAIVERGRTVINLYGAYSHNIDTQSRLSLPAKFRKKLPEDLVVVVEPRKQCLYVFDEDGFDDYVNNQLFAKKGGYDPLNDEHVELRRQIMEYADGVTVDSAGRIKLSDRLCEVVGITREAELIGNAGYFEVWDAKRREEVRNSANLADLLQTKA